MEAQRLSKCEYGTGRRPNLLKMPLAYGVGSWAGIGLGSGLWAWAWALPLSSWQQLHFTDLRFGAPWVACVACY